METAAKTTAQQDVSTFGCLPPLLSSFQRPRKSILSPEHLLAFQESALHQSISSYILALNESVVNVKLTDSCEESEAVKAILRVLDRVEQVAIDTPPVDNEKSRFGNPAFKTFYDKVKVVGTLCSVPSFSF